MPVRDTVVYSKWRRGLRIPSPSFSGQEDLQTALLLLPPAPRSPPVLSWVRVRGRGSCTRSAAMGPAPGPARWRAEHVALCSRPWVLPDILSLSLSLGHTRIHTQRTKTRF